MGATQRLEAARQAAIAVREHNAQREAMLARSPYAPYCGDLFTFPKAARDTDIRWAVLSQHPDEPSFFFAVPLDGNPLAGVCDVAAGPYALRCGYGLWLKDDLLTAGAWAGRLGETHIRRGREKMREIVTGALTASSAQKEAEADPDYEDWLKVVARAVGRLDATR